MYWMCLVGLLAGQVSQAFLVLVDFDNFKEECLGLLWNYLFEPFFREEDHNLKYHSLALISRDTCLQGSSWGC